MAANPIRQLRPVAHNLSEFVVGRYRCRVGRPTSERLGGGAKPRADSRQIRRIELSGIVEDASAVLASNREHFVRSVIMLRQADEGAPAARASRGGQRMPEGIGRERFRRADLTHRQRPFRKGVPSARTTSPGQGSRQSIRTRCGIPLARVVEAPHREQRIEMSSVQYGPDSL